MGTQAPPEVGATFAGRYRIVRPLASGGMASVYVAVHLATEMKVALKLLHLHVLELESARESFELEAKVAARVLSPHVVQVLDAGVDEPSGIPFLTMELLEGATVARHVERRGALPKETVLEWLRQAAEALDAAHGHRNEAGELEPIVHRDLKPENLFIHEPRGVEPQLKILDFGIAKIASHSAVTSQQIRGTPLFISFEQLTAGRVTPSTDVWSLGLIAFYLLTGRHYWLSATRDAQLEALYAEIVSLPLEAPSERLPRLGVRAAVTPEFDAWFLRTVNRDRAARFPTAGGAVRELAACLEGWQVAPETREPAPVLPESTLSSPGAAVAIASAAPPPTLVSARPPSVLTSSPVAQSFPAVESEPRPARRVKARTVLTMAAVAAIAGAAYVGLRESSSAGSPGEPPEHKAREIAESGERPRAEPALHAEQETLSAPGDGGVRPSTPFRSPTHSADAGPSVAPPLATAAAVGAPAPAPATAGSATSPTFRQPKPKPSSDRVDPFDVY